jgi:hypothetical protein
LNGIKAFYEYLKARPRIHEFHRIPLPVTEYQENLKEANRSPLEMFLIDLSLSTRTRSQPLYLEP